MRKLWLAIPLALMTFGSCASYGYEAGKFYSGLGARRDGRANAFGRDLRHIQDTIDRHFFNYSPTDPYVNFPTSTPWIEHPWRFMVTMFTRW